MRTVDLAVIGSGPGGYVAALRAAQLGMEVAVVERDELGGVCTNRGCIPTKAMCYSAALVHELRRAAKFGAVLEGRVHVDFPAVLKHRDQVVRRSRKGVQALLKQAGIQIVKGHASFAGPTILSVDPYGDDKSVEEDTIEARHIIVATGSAPVALAVPGANHPRVIDSDGALSLVEMPKRMLVVGAGAVGCEWSQIFARLGAEVTLVETLPTILPREDPEISAVLAKVLRSEGITIHASTTPAEVKEGKEGLEVLLEGAGAGTVTTDYVLIGAGRRPLTDGLALDKAGVRTDAKGWIVTDQYQHTSVPSVRAIGDVTGQTLLAHVASRQGIVAVEHLAGLRPEPVRTDRIPSVTYTDPEVAGVGMTEAQAKEKGLSVTSGTFPFSASGRARAQGAEVGLAKVIADSRFGRILGVQLVGSHVGELLAEAVLALELEATLDELTSVIRAHPTLSETLGEAALAAAGKALHSL